MIHTAHRSVNTTDKAYHMWDFYRFNDSTAVIYIKSGRNVLLRQIQVNIIMVLLAFCVSWWTSLLQNVFLNFSLNKYKFWEDKEDSLEWVEELDQKNLLFFIMKLRQHFNLLLLWNGGLPSFGARLSIIDLLCTFDYEEVIVFGCQLRCFLIKSACSAVHPKRNVSTSRFLLIFNRRHINFSGLLSGPIEQRMSYLMSGCHN